MKFFADTANTDEIQYCFSREVNDGITTNPKIMESTGDLSLGFIPACQRIVSKYSASPVSLETDLRGIDVKNLSNENPKKVRNVLLAQAFGLVNLGDNVIIKIPVCAGGLLAAQELRGLGIKTNITACMTPYQALIAAESGFGYVSLFANRMLDSHILNLAGYEVSEALSKSDWKEILKNSKEKYFEKAWELTQRQISHVAERLDSTGVDLIVGSIRTPEDIYKIAKAEPQVITIPTKIVKGLENIFSLKQQKRSISSNLDEKLFGNSLEHPMTQYTLEEFENSADTYRKD